jgi:pimeloyl-ACP methyl ester carboxylesterase
MTTAEEMQGRQGSPDDRDLSAAAAVDEPRKAWPGHGVDVGRQRVHVRRAGTPGAPPALFVHGLGGSSTNWTDLMALLADRVDGHAIDLPGFGRSGPPVTGSYSLDSHVGVVRDYIEQTCAGPVHLLGNSLGGAVTTRLAAERPDLVRTLTLVSAALPSYRPQKVSDPRLPLLLVPGLSRMAARALGRRSPEERTRGVIEMCFADPSAVPQARFAEAVDDMRRRRALAWNDDALIRSLRGLVRADVETGPRALWRQAASLRMPVLVIHGTHDRLVPVAVGRRAGRVIPGSRLLILDDAGHVPQMERPEAVERAFHELLAAAAAAA